MGHIFKIHCIHGKLYIHTLCFINENNDQNCLLGTISPCNIVKENTRLKCSLEKLLSFTNFHNRDRIYNRYGNIINK